MSTSNVRACLLVCVVTGACALAATGCSDGGSSEYTVDAGADGTGPTGGAVTYRRLHTSGFTAPGGSCGNFGVGNGGSARLRFAMVGDEDTSLLPGEGLESGSVELGTDAVTLSSARLFDVPDLSCAGGGGRSCSSPYQCERAKGQAEKRCQASTEISVESVKHLADTDSDQLFGVVVENSRTMGGWYPEETQQTSYDADGDGTTDVQVPAAPRNAIATDPDNVRKSVLSVLAANWRTARRDARRRGHESRFGLWAIDGERPPITSYVDRAGGSDSAFTSTPDTVSSAVSEFRAASVDGAKIGNVYETMHAVLSEGFGSNRYSDFDKTMVVLVDGPPARSRPSGRAGGVAVSDVIGEAKSQGVRIFVVHLDPALDLRADGTGNELLYDDPTYWSSQESSCSGGGCKNFEACRKVHGYSESGVGSPADRNGGGEKWCMPERRPDGRLGPIREYSRIACETRGGYLYIESAADLGWAMEWLPYTMDGLWEAEVTVGAASRGDVSGSTESLRVQSTVEVEAGGTRKAVDLSQVGGNAGETSEAGDTRGVLFPGR